MRLGLRVPGLLQLPDARCRVHPRIAGIALQGFFPERVGIERGIVELLDFQAGEVELLVGLELAEGRREAVGLAGIGSGFGWTGA